MNRIPRYRNRSAEDDACRKPAPRGQECTLLARCVARLAELREWGVPLIWAHIPDVRIQRGTAGRQQARRKGLPDLIIGAPALNLVLGCECKTECGIVSPEQGAWLAAFGDRGCVVRHEDDLLALLKRHGVVR